MTATNIAAQAADSAAPAGLDGGGCAPILPSVGLLDAMRVGSDVATTYRPQAGNASSPGRA